MKTYCYIEKILIEYLQLANQKDILKTIDDPIYIVFNGLKMLVNIIKYVWSKTWCNEKMYTISTNAYMVYLEYVEQMYKTSITYELNNTNIINDSIIFVMKKTDEQLETDTKQSKPPAKPPGFSINKYLDMAMYLVCFQSNYDTTTNSDNRIQVDDIDHMQKLADTFLLKYFKTIEYLDNEKVDSIIYYLTFIQEKCEMKFNGFLKFQECVLKKIKKWCEKDINQQKINNKLFDIFYNEEIKNNMNTYMLTYNYNEIMKIVNL